MLLLACSCHPCLQCALPCAVMHTMSLCSGMPALAITFKDSCLPAVFHAAALPPFCAGMADTMLAMPAQGATLCCCILWEPLGCPEAGLDLQAVLCL